MKRKNYIKPSFKFVQIEWNDLCAGSKCTTIDINVVGLKERKEKTYTFKRGETHDKNMWETSF